MAVLEISNLKKGFGGVQALDVLLLFRSEMTRR